VKALSELIIREWGGGRVEISQLPGAPHEANLLHLNCDKAHQLMQWRPKWDVERAIGETVAWYRGIRQGRNALEMSGHQIADYMGS
jgi:CDP-glucose 4,6-dehydratase